jgi:outer membrane lipoprotein carrier protein
MSFPPTTCAVLRLLVLGCLILPALGASADSAGDPSAAASRLEQILADLQSFRAHFDQEVRNRDLELIEAASGEVSLQKPGRFRWDYQEPFERLIVADGERVWLYEADLDQVTVQKLDASLGETPAALLTGTVGVLERFDLRAAEQRGDRWSVTLGPRDEAADFESIRLEFVAGQLAQMELADRLGQTTRIVFSDVERNPLISADTFAFVVPPGADVIGENEL